MIEVTSDGLPGPEEGHDDGEPDGHLGGGHGDDEEEQGLAVRSLAALAIGAR